MLKITVEGKNPKNSTKVLSIFIKNKKKLKNNYQNSIKPTQ